MQNLFDLVVLLLFFVLLLKLLLQWGSFQFFMTYLLFIVSFGFEREEFFFFFFFFLNFDPLTVLYKLIIISYMNISVGNGYILIKKGAFFIVSFAFSVYICMVHASTPRVFFCRLSDFM
jgi:hypothetical protein